jgi:hypothetical protein
MIKDLRKILQQVHEPDEYQLIPHNLEHPLYWIWKLENAKMKDLNSYLRPYRKEHARFDIFINGQYILEKDYIFESVGKDFHVKFIKANFVGAYNLEIGDNIKIEGDIDLV